MSNKIGARSSSIESSRDFNPRDFGIDIIIPNLQEGETPRAIVNFLPTTVRFGSIPARRERFGFVGPFNPSTPLNLEDLTQKDIAFLNKVASIVKGIESVELSAISIKISSQDPDGIKGSAILVAEEAVKHFSLLYVKTLRKKLMYTSYF